MCVCCVGVCIYACVSICVCVDVSVCVYTFVSMCVCACMCLCMCECICAHRVAVKECTLTLSWAKPTVTVDNKKMLCVAGKRS